MALASSEAFLMAKAPNLADLTMTGAIKLLEELRAPDESNSRQSGRRSDPVAAAIKKGPLGILERAWQECSDNEKNLFLSKVST